MLNIIEINNLISNELVQVEDSLKMSLKDLDFDINDNSYKAFFEDHIKHICSALLLLSARCLNPQPSENVNNQSIQMGAIMDFVYNAVFVHNSLSDCGKVSYPAANMNRFSNNKIAVLGGDILYTLAFLMTSEQFNSGFMKEIAQLTEKMCLAEIKQRRNNIYSSAEDSYYGIVEDKTAHFMAACCKFGAQLNGADEMETNSLECFGLNFGMAFQIIHDCADNTSYTSMSNGISRGLAKEANKFINQAKQSINDLPDSDFKNGLLNLAEYIKSPAFICYRNN